jgi:DNA repair exonuclease SbcCD nuclease subunit
MVPWMQNQHYNEYKSIIENSSADILCAHLECSGFLMHAGVVSTDGMTMEPFQTFNKVLSGHYHSKSQRENIYYLGTAYDMSWADVFDKKYFHTIDTETMELVPYEYTDKLFNRIVYNDSVDTDILDSIKQLSLSNKFVKLIVRSKTDVLGFESVMSYISNQNPAELSVVDETILLNSAYKDSVVSDTVTNINVVISSAIDGLQDTDSIDKDKLKTLMKDIYDKTLQESII